ncbi:MAG: HNH endonuclease [Acidobacteria bacterium]|nr:HNH endonuclease [Acidobacteriota bacterium]
MASKNLSREFLDRLKAVTSKRPRTVIEHILKHGFITTEELKAKYGYNHPPRAARDVREQGIPVETFTVEGSDGRKIAAYRFGDPSAVRRGFIGGRHAFPKAFKVALLESNGSRCHICFQEHAERYLQIDHRIPYEVAGDVAFSERHSASYMLLCGSCNRAKSWSCEHCRNWTDLKSTETCAICYWASPESYSHIAMQDARRLDLVWLGNETKVYDKLRGGADAAKEDMPAYVKRILRQIISKR